MHATASIYLTLTKPRIWSMVLVTTATGYFIGAGGALSGLTLCLTLLGTALASGGSAVLNNFLEREIDAKMERTRLRALPTGQIAPNQALAYGAILVLSGVFLLLWKVNLLTSFLVLLAAFLYVLVYTPMKRHTWLNTSVGAIPGAIPPLAGWAAATGTLEPAAWILFVVLFAWQHPHFYAIAWMFKDDYERGGLKMLPVIDQTGQRTFRHVLFYLGLLLVTSLLPSFIGVSGWFYAVGALVLGLGFFSAGISLARSGSTLDARRLLKASVLYLPLWLVFVVLDTAI